MFSPPAAISLYQLLNENQQKSANRSFSSHIRFFIAFSIDKTARLCYNNSRHKVFLIKSSGGTGPVKLRQPFGQPKMVPIPAPKGER